MDMALYISSASGQYHRTTPNKYQIIFVAEQFGAAVVVVVFFSLHALCSMGVLAKKNPKEVGWSNSRY